MADHDQALAWAQANPTDPRAQDVMAKAWASKNPSDPRSAQIMARFGGQSGQQPQDNVLTRLAKNYAQYMGGVVSGGIKGLTFGRYDPLPELRDNAPTGGAVGQLVGGLEAGLGVGSLASSLAPAGAGALSALGRIGVNTASGVGQVLAQKPDDGESTLDNINPLKHPVKTTMAFLPGAMSAASEVAAPLLKSAANSSMLRAVGLTGAKSKNIPSDLGNRMVDEGIWGTKAGMAKQVASKYADAEDEMQKLAEGLEGNVGGDTLAKAIAEKSKQYLNPEDASKVVSGREGGVSAFSNVSDAVRKGAAGFQEGSPEVTTVRNMVGEGGDLSPISSQTTPAIPVREGTYGGKGLLALKRAGDSEAFNQSGQMGNTYLADAYRAQADEARSALAGLSDGAIPEALKREQTLLYANKGLMQPMMVAKNPVSLTDIGSALLGSGSGGLPGAGTAVLASKAAVSPLVQSLFAKGAQASSKLATQVADPAVLQSLFGAANASSSGAK